MNPWKVENNELVFECGCHYPIIKVFDDPTKMPTIKFNPRKIVFCEATKQLFASGKTKGVFQLEKQLGQTWARRLKPETKEQVSGLVSVLRPGTLRVKDDNGVSMTQHYVNRKNKIEAVGSYHPVVDKVLEDSFNVLIYQEQSMKLAVECAKFTPTEADSLRRCVTGDTRFLTGTNGWMTIESLLHNDEYKNHKFLVIKEGRSVYKSIEKIWLTGERPVKRVTTENGMGVKATKNHEFLTTKGWKRRDELEVDDKLVVPKIWNFINGEHTLCGFAGLGGDDVEFAIRRSREGNQESKVVVFNKDIFKNNSGMNPIVLRMFSVKEAVRIERAHVRFSSNSLELLRGAQLMLTQVGIDSLVEDFSNSLVIDDVGSLHLLNENLKLHRIPNNIEGGIAGLIKGRPIKDTSKDTTSILDIHGGNERVKVYDFTMVDGDVPHIVANGLIIHNSIGKKDAKEMAKNKLLFIEKAKEAKIISEEQAAELFDWIEKSNRYSFNHCVSGDTKIRRASKGKFKFDFTIEEMYKISNDIRYAEKTGHSVLRRKYMRLGYGLALSMDKEGRIRPNKIVDIKPAGVRKVYKLLLQNGSYIKATENHKFPTILGEKRLDELYVGQELFICGEYEKTFFNPINSFSKVTKEEINNRNSIGKAVNKSFGEDNWAYTNGAYTEFIKNKDLLSINCELCNKNPTQSRMEIHHRNGDRSNSALENLQKLCVSCHKIEQYKLGRTKRGEKGYPSLTSKIVSIKLDSECETYDVEMEAPNHNFVVSTGIVTCNSHAWSYGLRSIKTAYLKAHFPLYFFANWLKFAHTKQDAEGEANELVEDAKNFDTRVVCPDMRYRNARVKLGHKRVVFGMADVGGVGETFVEVLLVALEKAEAKLGKKLENFTWTELLMEVLYDKNSKAIDGLICTGTFAWFPVTRQRQRNEYLALHKFKTKKTLIKWLVENRESGETLVDLLKKAAKLKKDGGGCSNAAAISEVQDEISLLENPPTPEDDNPRVISDFETRLLGVAVSCSMLDGCDTSGANATCSNFADKSVSRGFVAAIVTSAHKHTTKADKEMVFLTVTDQSGTLQNIVVFSDLFEEHKSILREGNALLLQLESGRDDGFIVKTIAQI